MSVRRRIFVPMIMLTVVCCVAVFVSAILLFNRELNSAMEEKTAVAMNVIEHEINELILKAQLAAFALSDNQNLGEAILQNNRDTILEISTNLKTLAQLDFCTIVDVDGIVLSRTHEPDNYGDTTELAHIMSALEGRIESHIVSGVTILLGVMAGAPIRDENMNIVGAVSLGFRLDVQAFAHKLSSLTGCEITVFLGDIRVSSTIIDEEGLYVLGTRAAEHISERVLQGESYLDRIQLFGRDVLAKYSPLEGADGEVIGMMFVGYYMAEDLAKVRMFILVGTLITFVVIGICIFIASFVSGAIEHRLESMMIKISEADERTLLMLDTSPLCVQVFSRDFKTIDCNEAALRLYGFKDKQEYIDRFFEDCSPKYQPDGTNSYEETIRNIIKAFDTGRHVFEWTHKIPADGVLSDIVLPAEITLVRAKYGESDVVVAYTRDLREQKAYIDEINKARDVAEAANQTKSSFLANMSHEIRTPVNVILGTTEILLQSNSLPLEIEEGLDNIYNSCDMLLGIINDILDLSKIEAGKLDVLPAQYRVTNMVNDAVQLNMIRIGDKPLEFELQISEDMPAMLFGDELRIKQILNNLLSNAFKYTDSGKVTLSVEVCRNDNLANSAGVTETLVLGVYDTGHGMTEEQIGKLFSEYTRLNERIYKGVEGVGLGLAITHRLLTLMNGEISVESEPNVGSQFIVRLPQGRVGPEVIGSKVAEDLRRFRTNYITSKKRGRINRDPMPYGSVLIVDDVETNIYVAEGLMKLYRLQIDTVMSGQEAINKIKNGKEYDIIFMDHMMPEMNGIEAAKNLRALGYTRPIVALTANAVAGQADIFIKNGFDDFVPKPIDVRRLNSVLNWYIRDKQPPEVVEAARRQMADSDTGGGYARYSREDLMLINSFIRDARKFIAALDKFCQDYNWLQNEEDLEKFTITVHGVKSSLGIIGETKMSSMAARLERAGRDGNVDLIKDSVFGFLEDLRALLAELVTKRNAGCVDEDIGVLRKKLMSIKEACAIQSREAALGIIADIVNGSEKTWAVIDAITEHIMHSEFEEALGEAAAYAEEMHQQLIW